MGNKIQRKMDKNKNYRILVKKFEMKKLVQKYANDANDAYYLNNLKSSPQDRYNSVSIIKNMCTQSGRYRGILSYFKLSRMKLKELGSSALLPGLRRSSW